MAKTKSKPEKTMEERKLDSLQAIAKQLRELNKNIAARFPERDGLGNLIATEEDYWDEDD